MPTSRAGSATIADVTSGQVPGVRTHAVVAPAASLLMRKPALLHLGAGSAERQRAYNSDIGSCHPVCVYEIPEGKVVGRGICATSTDTLLVGSPLVVRREDLKGSGWTGGRDLTAKENWPASVIHVTDPVVPLLRAGDHIYGHWLVDILPRALLANQHVGPHVKFVMPSKTPAFAGIMLEALGIDRSRLLSFDEATTVLSAPAVFVVSHCRHGNFANPGVDISAAARAVGDRLEGLDDDPADPRRLYLSRAAWGSTHRTLLNREEVEAVFRDAGYAVIRPEELPLARQVRLFRRAEVLAGEAGSALHNSIFAGPALRVLALQSRADGSFVQSAICETARQGIGFVHGESFDRPRLGRLGQWVVDLAAVRSAAEQILP